MAGVIVSGNFAKDLLPNHATWFGAAYNNHPTLYTRMFEMSSSDWGTEEDILMSGFGLARERAQGESMTYDSHSQGAQIRYTHAELVKGYIISRIAIEDGKSTTVEKARAEALKKSMMDSVEILAANVINRAFNSSYVGYDGVELVSASHVAKAGTQSNLLANNPTFSEAALEDMIIQLASLKDDVGLYIAASPKQLLIPHALQFEVERLLRSKGRVGTANNDANVVGDMFGSLDVVVNPYFTSATQWLLKTDIKHGLKGFIRRPFEFTDDHDGDTDNAKFKASWRGSFGFTDYRCVIGSSGT